MPGGTAGIVLCGGRSQRMGHSKLWLPIGQRVLLQQVADVLSTVVSPVVVVAGPNQELPSLPADVRVVRDAEPALGPAVGLAGGLRALPANVETVYVTGCDAPLLRAEFVRAVLAELGAANLLGEANFAVPYDGEFSHPLAGAYRVGVLPILERFLAEGDRRLTGLLSRTRGVLIPVDRLRSADPRLDSLRTCNTPADYAQVLRDLDAPPC